MSCRTGPLRAGRPLRGVCTGLGDPIFLGPAVGGLLFFELGAFAAEDLAWEFGAGCYECEACGCGPDCARGGDGEDVFRMGGDWRQDVRYGCSCDVGDERGEKRTA